MKKNWVLPLMLIASLGCETPQTPEARSQTTETNATPAAPATPNTASQLPAVMGPKLLPVDEATKDPSLVAFRTELLAAVRARDFDKIVSMTDPKIRTDFGGGGGSDALRKALQDADVLRDLEFLLTHGGKFVGESFWAPYVYSAWPEAHDAFEHYAVIGENVPLYDRQHGQVIANLSHDIVRRASDVDAINIRTADGRQGWIEPGQLYSPVGYRAGFVRVGGRWKMNALVAGD